MAAERWITWAERWHRLVLHGTPSNEEQRDTLAHWSTHSRMVLADVGPVRFAGHELASGAAQISWRVGHGPTTPIAVAGLSMLVGMGAVAFAAADLGQSIPIFNLLAGFGLALFGGSLLARPQRPVMLPFILGSIILLCALTGICVGVIDNPVLWSDRILAAACLLVGPPGIVLAVRGFATHGPKSTSIGISLMALTLLLVALSNLHWAMSSQVEEAQTLSLVVGVVEVWGASSLRRWARCLNPGLPAVARGLAQQFD